MGSPINSGNMFSSRSPFSRAIMLTIFCLTTFIYTLKPSAAYRSRAFKPQAIPIHIQLNSTGTLPIPTAAPYPRDCSFNSTHLQKLQEWYGLEETIEYARRYIRFHRQDITRKSITKIDTELFPNGFDIVDIHNPPTKATCLKPLDVPVPNSPFPKTANASDFLFGISTTYSRLNDPKIGPMKEWAHWLSDGKGNSNGGGLVLRLVDASEEELDHTRQKLRNFGIDAKVYPSDSTTQMAQRYLSLLPALYNDPSRGIRKWLVMCDDDTFYPSMQALKTRLDTYDHTTDLYIGTFSEDVNNIQRHGSQAFGGAGVFFTLSLAEKIAALYDQCSTEQKVQESNTGWGPQGDILLRKCIYENTEVRLTMLRDLHQLDIMGDPSGFYESGIAPLSLHHFKGGMWHEAKPLAGAQIIHACGEDCFLQRFQTADKFIISNGYSIAQYPKGIDFNTHQMERTFGSAPDDYGWNLDFMLGPGRNSLLGTGRKAAWEMKEAEVQKDGSVRQVYVRKSNDKRWTEVKGEDRYRMFDKDGVVELIWIP